MAQGDFTSAAGRRKIPCELDVGLTSATLLAQFLVPAIYCILDDFKLLGEITAEPDEPPGDAAPGIPDPASRRI